MVTIPQHGPAGELYDMQSFLADVDSYFTIDAWRIRVQECLGEGADEVERASAAGLLMSDASFREAYSDLYQTIDGEFVALSRGAVCCTLQAVDSTSWDVSGTPDFEAHMRTKYHDGSA